MTAQDFSRASDQPTWDQCFGIDRLAVSIDIEDRNRGFSPPWLLLPQRSSPACERFCQKSIGSHGGQLCQKPLGLAIAVGPRPFCQQCQSLTSVAAQIPGSSESDGLQKQECEQEA